MPTCPRPPAPVTTAVHPAGSLSRLETFAWYGVGERDGLHRVEVAERDQVPDVVDDHVLGQRARGAQPEPLDAQRRRTRAVVLPTPRARGAQPAPPRAVDGDRIAHREAGDAVPKRVDDPSALCESLSGGP